MKLPRYPVYVPSKGRAKTALTPRFLARDKVPFHIVVEPQDHDEYAERWGVKRLLVLPENDKGLVYARNWIKAHSIAEYGAERHWQIDDNCRRIVRVAKGLRIKAPSGVALRVVEDFTDRYENVGLSGLAYAMFVPPNLGPFTLNCHIYSCLLVQNSLPYKWRNFNDDVDMSLQILSGGLCTVLVNVFAIEKLATMTMKGGMTSNYERDGRLRLAKSAERVWPYITYTKRRFSKAQVHVRNSWKFFDTKLKLKPDAKRGEGEYGLKLKQLDPNAKGEELTALLDEYGRK